MMKFLRLNDYLPTVLFEDADIIAIDKPYGFNAHTNDSKMAHSDMIEDGLIEIYEKLRGQKLHIIHRLDQTTTGVMIFGKSVASAKKYAEYFFNREVKKTYWFVTASSSLKQNFEIDDIIIHKGKELEAKTLLQIIKKNTNFELWQASPQTGRNHQIRIHAKSAGVPILGDEKYGGKKFDFLCLHNHLIQFPNGISIKSLPPTYFENLDLLNDSVLARSLFETDRRKRIFSNSENQCYRLAIVKNNQGGTDYTLDQLGEVLVLNWHKQWWADDEISKFTKLAKMLNKPMVVNQVSTKIKSILNFTEKIKDISSIWTANENNTLMQLSVNTVFAATSTLSQRLQRYYVSQNSSGKSVLNLFSGSGGYATSAAVSARQVTSVELSKNLLNSAKLNLEINNFNSEKNIFLCRDSLTYLDQCIKKELKFDIITCEVPSFYKREKTTFKIKNDLELLIKNLLLSLNPKGELLLSTHADDFFIDDLRKLFLNIQTELKLNDLEINSIMPSLDFELNDERAQLKSFLIRLI